MENLRKRKKHKGQEYLPTLLIKRLCECIMNNGKYQYPTKNNLLQAVVIIYYYQVQQGHGITDYVPLGSSYWKKIYGGNYHASVITPLLDEHDIIESYDFGYRTFPDKTKNNSKGKQGGLVGIRYRINPNLLNDQYEAISYIKKGNDMSEEKVLAQSEAPTAVAIPNDNFKTSIDVDKANTWIDNNAENICNEYLKIDYVNTIPDSLAIECKELVNSCGRYTYNRNYYSVKSAKFIAEVKNMELFYFKNSFYIADIKGFLKHRKQLLIHYYKHQVSLVNALPIEEKRSSATLRLYSQLTSFPSKILKFINLNNKTVVQLDLRTSQFLIFANLINVYLCHGEAVLLSKFKQEKNQVYLRKLISILNKYKQQLPEVGVDINNCTSGKYSSSDVTRFITDIFFNDFYEVVQLELSLEARILAKSLLFKLLFKKSNRTDALLDKLSKHYPVVMGIISEFKKIDKDEENKEHGSNFSVFLQCIESEIFIDNILKNLRDDDVPVFTRHDSIVVASGHEEHSEAIAKEVFNDFGFKYNHKVEDMFWDVFNEDELEESGYLEWYSDENEMSQNFSLEDSFGDSIVYKYKIIDNMDEQELKTIEKLEEIGICDNYNESVNADFLEDIVLLPFLNEHQRNILYEDINNLQYGMSFLQKDSIKLLRHLVAMSTDILQTG